MKQAIDTMISGRLDKASKIRNSDLEYHECEERVQELIKKLKNRLPCGEQAILQEIVDVEEERVGISEAIIFREGITDGIILDQELNR